MLNRFLLFVLILSTGAVHCKSHGKKTSVAERPGHKPPVKPAHPPVVEDIPNREGAAGIAWLEAERLMPVLELAQRDNKPVFVEFYASWCAPCKVLEEEVFPHPEVASLFNARFLNFKTDFDSPAGATIASIYEVSSLPTLLFLDPKGVVLVRHRGMTTPTALRQMADSALEKMGKK